MRHARHLPLALALVTMLGVARPAEARNPPNPYSSFNLSGINYGSMQWEKAQRQGRRVWPYYNTPTRSYYRGGAVSVGGAVTGGSRAAVRTNPRRWRR